MLPRPGLDVRSQQICKVTPGLRALVMTLNESWESMHAEGAWHVINNPHATSHFLSCLFICIYSDSLRVQKELGVSWKNIS